MRQPSLSSRILLAASIGNALEWYDFGLYGFFAITLQKIFFPFQNTLNGLLSVFLVFAVGLFMRPLGGIVFGYIGDKIGRRTALIVSIFAMALPTFLIGCLPSYEQVGVFAIVFFVLARLFQGLAVGGEFIGATVFLAEHAPPGRRGFFCSLIYSIGTFGGLLGAVTGILLNLYLTQEDIVAWGWRLPFLAGIAPAAVGIYIRLKIAETPLFLQLQKAHRTTKHPLEAIEAHPKQILITFLLAAFQAVGFYLPFVYLASWFISSGYFTNLQAFSLNSIGLFLVVILIPFFATLSDRIGRRKVLMSSCLLTCILGYPIFQIISLTSTSSHPLFFAFLAMFLFAVLAALYQGPLPAALAELVSTRNRYMTLAIGYNTSAAFFGGITPFLSTVLISYTGLAESPSFLIILTSIGAFLTVLFLMKESYRLSFK